MLYSELDMFFMHSDDNTSDPEIIEKKTEANRMCSNLMILLALLLSLSFLLIICFILASLST